MNEIDWAERKGALIAEAPAGKEIDEECESIKVMLLKKNISYGNSALNPIRVFSKADAEEQILVRIDDKLNRLMKGEKFIGDNDLDDLIGYLILLKVNRRINKPKATGGPVSPGIGGEIYTVPPGAAPYTIN